jgi:glutamyl endopeptidase
MHEQDSSDGKSGPPQQGGQPPSIPLGQPPSGAPPSQSGHESVSSEGKPGEAIGAEESSPSFPGEGGSGELERVPGFNESAIESAIPGARVPISPELEKLPDAGSLAYETPETVCGSDDRTQVTATANIPWRWICQLIIQYPNGAGARGTGWFIGPHTVMTAGHVVFSQANGGWARQIEVIPGMNGALRPFGSQIGTSFRSVVGWTQSTNPEYDYGAIILPNNDLGNRVGWFGFAVLSDAGLNGLLVNLSGYAGDKPFGTQWFMAGTISAVQPRRLRYMVDTFAGQSGSPVWRLSSGQRHAVGIHAYGGCPNGATRIIQPVFNNMIAWKA